MAAGVERRVESALGRRRAASAVLQQVRVGMCSCGSDADAGRRVVRSPGPDAGAGAGADADADAPEIRPRDPPSRVEYCP